MINFYELYKLFLTVKNNFHLTIICFYIFFLIYSLLKYKEELEKMPQKDIKEIKGLLLISIFTITLCIFGIVINKNATEYKIKNFKKEYNLKINEKIFLKQAKKLEKFCEIYNKKKEYLDDFCNSNPKGVINVDQSTFNQIFNEIYKNDFNKLKAEKEIKETKEEIKKTINYIIKEE